MKDLKLAIQKMAVSKGYSCSNMLITKFYAEDHVASIRAITKNYIMISMDSNPKILEESLSKEHFNTF